MLISRIRWDLSDEMVPSRDQPTIVRTFIYLFGLGGTLVLMGSAIGGQNGAWVPGLIIPALVAYATTAFLLVSFERTPRMLLVALPTHGDTVDHDHRRVGWRELGIAICAALYFWAVLAAASFFPTRIVVANLFAVGIAYGGALIFVPGVDDPAIRWIVATGTLIVLAAVVSALRRRQEQLVDVLARRALKQKQIAELGKLALGGADPTKLSRHTAQAVADGLRVKLTAVFSLHPDEEELSLRAWERRGPLPSRSSGALVSATSSRPRRFALAMRPSSTKRDPVR